ncbi:MAG: MFS transporter [Acidimicrobiia bacterium]|nr:MFS transporter [Acidimicrobiia bacterium]
MSELGAASGRRLERRHWYLLGVLGVASFFDGYDFSLLAFILPELKAQFGLTNAQASAMLAVIFFGAIPALFLSRRADVVGRRKILFISIVGYTLFTGATALSPNVWVFACFQILARFFILVEAAVAHVMVAEELPARSRGFGFGFLAMLTGVGTGMAAGMNIVFSQADINWRWLYVIGLPLLLVVTVLRSALPESKRFESARDEGRLAKWSLILKPPHRRWLALVTIVAFSAALIQQPVEFAVTFLQDDRGFTRTAASVLLVLAGIPTLVLMPLGGALSDRIGRRAVGGTTAALAVVGGGLFYTVDAGLGFLAITLGLTVAGFAIAQPTISAYNAELFPTSLRSQAGAWTTMARSVGQVMSFVLAIPLLAATDSLSSTTIVLLVGPVIAVVLLFAFFPDTHGRELEDTSGELVESA